MSAPLRDVCRGKWPSLLVMLGVDRRYLSGKHGPCPICGGKDRFRFDDKDGLGKWICNHCGAGDGFALLMKLRGWDFKQTAEEVEAIVGKAELTVQRRSRDQESLRAAMNRMWTSGKPLSVGDPVAYYLESRGVVLEDFPATLRYVERCRYQDDGSFHPAMIAKVQAPDGSPQIIHRTYLNGNGGKADLPKPRMLMPGKFGKGSAIRLAPAADVLGVAEGIETALSASILFSVPVWAAVNAGMMMAWEPPETVKELIIFADNDATFAGQSAAYALAHRLSVRKDVRVDVAVPPKAGDWNDVLRAKSPTYSAAAE